MAEQFGRTQNLSFYDQALLHASGRAKALTMKMTGGKPDPAMEAKITIGLLAQLVAPGIENALRAEGAERDAATGEVITGAGTEQFKGGARLKRDLREKVKRDVMAAAKRLGAMKVAEVLVAESPKIYQGWKKAQDEKVQGDLQALLDEPSGEESGFVRGRDFHRYRLESGKPDPFPKEYVGPSVGEPHIREGFQNPYEDIVGFSLASAGDESLREGGVDLFDLAGSPYEREADYFTKMFIEGGAAPLQERLV